MRLAIAATNVKLPACQKAKLYKKEQKGPFALL